MRPKTTRVPNLQSGFVWWSRDGKHKLTFKQKRFCDAYLAKGLTNTTECAIEAGYTTSSPSATREAVRHLLKHAGVRAYLREYRPKYEESLLITRDYVIEKLKGIAEGSKNDNARVGALKHLGQFLGMWVDRTEITGKDGGPVGFADQSADLSGVPEENLRRVKELLSARKSAEELN